MIHAKQEHPRHTNTGRVARKARLRLILRSMSMLKKYWPFVAGAYIVVLLSNGVSVWVPRLFQHIVDDGIRTGVIRIIISGSLGVLALALVRGLFSFLSGRWTERASQNVAYDLRNRFHRKLQQLSFSFHDESEAGQLLARSVSDVDRIRFLTGRAVLHLVQMTTLIIGIGIAMFVMNARLALPTLAIVPFLALGAFRFSSLFRPLSMLIRNREAILTTSLEQNLRGARIVKAFGREKSQINEFGDKNDSLLHAQKREAKLRSTFIPLMQFLASLGSLIVIIYGGSLVIREHISIGELVAFTTYVTQLLIPVRRIGFVLASIAQASASAERIFGILDLNPEILDAPDAVALDGIEGNVEFDHVSFAYSRSGKILDDITLTIKAGERIAVIGATGSGKSSIINLIPRFYEATEGAVRIDGVDVRTVQLQSLRSHIGIVLQDTVLFAGTIRENISFGKPGATKDEIEAAARVAGVHEFVTTFEHGYDTDVGEKGVTLSGGQKQRVSIARALLKNPEILILDDATSSVDTDTEQQIQAAMDKLMVGRTSIVIAQRLSTIQKSDTVVLLHQGRIESIARATPDRSPHQQLLQTSGLYAEIVKNQLKPEATK